jgi:hypothetical protein
MYFVTFTTAHTVSISIHNQSSSSGHPIRTPTGMPGRRFIRGRIGTHHGGWTRPPQRCSDHRGVVREGASILGAPRVWMMLGQKSGGPARTHTHAHVYIIYWFIYLFIYFSTYLFIYLIYSYIIYSFSVLFMRLFMCILFIYSYWYLCLYIIYTTYYIWHTMYPIISYPISYHMHIYTYNVIIT